VSKDLIIDVTTSEITIALLENKRLVELNKEKSNIQFSVGDIYLGRVKKTMPGLNAAFVDVGYEKDAFLHYLDLGPQFSTLSKYLNTAISKKGKLIPLNNFKKLPDINKEGKINSVLKAGQTVLVQIAKEPISTKGPRLSSEISIAGRNIVLIPCSDKVSVSQKIKSAEERKRLKTLMLSIRPKNYGIIVRTVAEGRKVAELDAELGSLVLKWEQAFNNISQIKPPKLVISELDRTSAILRDMLSPDFSSIVVNNESIYNEIKNSISSFAPGKEKIAKYFDKDTPLFEKFGINKQIKSLFGKTVTFKDGAYLIIEHTEALHVIDVNSGNRSKSGMDQETNAVEVNLAAADEIARQLRLRDMGGIIVIDFIDMIDNAHKQLIFEKMRKAMEDDRTKHNILPLSKFGLMQITRQRVRPEMNIETTEKCPTCKGSGKTQPSVLIIDELENNISFYTHNGNYHTLIVKVHPFIASYLTQGTFSSIRRKLSRKYHCRLKVVPEPSYHFLEYHFFNKDEEEILQ
jgi:ribonuclease G